MTKVNYSMSPEAAREFAYAERDVAEANHAKAETILALVAGGFTPKSASAYADSGDVNDLRHTGMVSVQLYKPGPAPEVTITKLTPAQLERDLDAAEARKIQDLVVEAILSAKKSGRL